MTPVSKRVRPRFIIKAADGIDATINVTVTDIAVDKPVNFPNQVTPIFTKYGCNGGGCHGKSGGQNGFALSLLGFEPPEDYEYLVKEGRGRRLFPSAPGSQLAVAEGHGQVASRRWPSARRRIRRRTGVLRRWIEQGMPYGSPDDPTVTHIEVLPEERLMDRDADQQVIVIAHYTDGHTEDVTRMTTFDSNDTEMAEVSVTGLGHDRQADRAASQ